MTLSREYMEQYTLENFDTLEAILAAENFDNLTLDLTGKYSTIQDDAFPVYAQVNRLAVSMPNSYPAVEVHPSNKWHGVKEFLMFQGGSACLLYSVFSPHIFQQHTLMALAQLGIIAAAQYTSFKTLKKKNMKHSEYDPNYLRIKLFENHREHLIPILAHEYTHHLQGETIGFDEMEHNIALYEGMARGVERHISKEYAKKENNPRFLHLSKLETLVELGRCYIESCEILEKKDQLNLPKTKAIPLSPHHALGNTFFTLLEHERGDIVYPQMLNGAI